MREDPIKNRHFRHDPLTKEKAKDHGKEISHAPIRNTRIKDLMQLGHYARDCWQGECAKNKPNNQANLAQDEGSNSKVVMLMATTSNESSNDTSWYLDSGYSTHMTGRKEWFISLDDSSKSKVRFADGSSLTAEGISRVAFRDTNGKETIIEEVLYVPGLKTNLLSLGKLLQKGICHENGGQLPQGI
ncbi:uncharacterized protein [Glycine max]|uniref:uncharacterized protein n=1 Tax=Glycine max TaxID=3847 RepID=UPI0003DEC45E|nr:uncharacterized protein LOC102664382 [Glycine max]|eukprot:XP_006588254.1 uncharacterized protein LOC102664382 [Glycine max]